MARRSVANASTSSFISFTLSPPFGGIPQAAHPERSGGLSGAIIQDNSVRGKSDIIGGRKDRLGEVKRVFLGLPKRGGHPTSDLRPSSEE
jgi:hypothetical protein